MASFYTDVEEWFEISTEKRIKKHPLVQRRFPRSSRYWY
jgi:hypothetical protein